MSPTRQEALLQWHDLAQTVAKTANMLTSWPLMLAFTGS